MKTLKITAVILGIAAAISVVAFLATRVNDPMFKGRRLSSYLEAAGFKAGGFQLIKEDFGSGPQIQMVPHDEEIKQAVQAVGTNAFPLLIRMVGTRESWIHIRADSLAEKHPFLRKFVPPRTNLAFARQLGGVVAFYHLGPWAAPAVPGLLPLLKDPDAAVAAILAVMYARPETEREILILTNVLGLSRSLRSDDMALLHAAAISALSTFGRKASGAIPLLMDQLSVTNETVRGMAAVALVKIGAPAERVVPLILTDLAAYKPMPMPPLFPPFPRLSDARSIQQKVWTLGEYGHEASAALPALSNLLTTQWMNLREEVEFAIKKITADTNRASGGPNQTSAGRKTRN
jgi:hypothetical protein